MKPSELRFVLLVIILITTFISCTNNMIEESAISGAECSENFIQVYIVPETIECRQYLDSSIEIKFGGKDLINTRASDESEYKKYSTKYGDVGYNKELVPFSNIVVGEDLEVLNVTCNKDFDDHHPAGSSLNDVIKLCATSPRDFIKNGYVGNPIPFPNGFIVPRRLYNLNHIYHPIFKLLSDLTRADLVLLEQYCYLYITSDLPAGTYVFMLEIKTVNNMVLKNSVEYIVE